MIHDDKTFDRFDLRRRDLKGDKARNLADAKRAAEAYAERPEGWLVIAGPLFCGKTHLAAAIANYRKSRFHEQPIFVVVPDLLDYLRAAFNPQSTAPLDVRFDELKRAPLLILDNLGIESATPWAREKLFQLLDYRYAARLPTVFTTRVLITPGESTGKTPRSGGKADIRAIEDVHPWLANRMLDSSRSKIVMIFADSYRGISSQDADEPSSEKDPSLQRWERDDRFRELV